MCASPPYIDPVFYFNVFFFSYSRSGGVLGRVREYRGNLEIDGVWGFGSDTRAGVFSWGYFMVVNIKSDCPHP